MNKNFVITGSAGYLGKDIVLELLKYGSNVLSFSSKDFAQDIDNEIDWSLAELKYSLNKK